jgi:hypothetical protein
VRIEYCNPSGFRREDMLKLPQRASNWASKSTSERLATNTDDAKRKFLRRNVQSTQGDGALALPRRHGQWSKHDSAFTVSFVPSVRSTGLSPSVAVPGGDGLSNMFALVTTLTRRAATFCNTGTVVHERRRQAIFNGLNPADWARTLSRWVPLSTLCATC